MANEIQIFNNAEFGNIRTIQEDGKVLFCGKDVATALGYSKPWDALERHCPYTTKRSIGVVTGKKSDGTDAVQNVETSFITEGDLYRLVCGSKLPSAEKFERWVFDEVLPTIRKTGSYGIAPQLPKDYISALEALLAAEKAKAALVAENAKQEQVIAELKPKANYTDRILQNRGLVAITQIAKDYGMSGRAMNSLLHQLGVQYQQCRQWLLYAKYQNKGYTHSHTIDIVRSDGSADVKMNTKWTQKGRLFLYNLLKEHGIFPIIEA